MKTIIKLFCLFIVSLGSAQEIDKSLYAFDFKMEHMPIPERTKLFSDLGYSGITLRVQSDKQRKNLKDYLNTNEFVSGKLDIPVVFFGFNFSNNIESQNKMWRKTLAALPDKTSLWVIINGDATKENTLTLLKDMAKEGQKLGKDIVIYPHDNCFIESAEDAIPYIEELNEPNLYLTFHLCHELRAGNGNRLLEVGIKAAPYLKFASISGSNTTMLENDKGNWSDAIQPLDKGDYDIKRFVTVLQKINFKGKTFLHTFGVEDEPQDHLSRSIAKWQTMVADSNQTLNKNISHILDNPESAFWDPISKTWFISNLGGEKVTLEKDAYGWITRLDENGKVISNRWIDGLDAPTGMASYQNLLYVADRGFLLEINISKGKIIRKIAIENSEFLNDVAADKDGNIYVSDTFTNTIYTLPKNKSIEVFVKNGKLEYPNGLWVDGRNLIIATWGPMTNRATFETSRKGTLMKINLKSKKIKPVGKGLPIANFDGIVKYGNYYYATDWTGGRLLKINKKGKVKQILSGFSQFADVGIDTNKGILMIPEMSKNRFIKVNLK
ncbi:TIM barrel protein [Flavicella sediminum]|uniref:TIM barrel protein n=1 Tax=Flavicella sediminum TaxID=2585141 RepID=UPI00111D79B3|nr:TIM barrel protein [Flavicella sediminum]